MFGDMAFSAPPTPAAQMLNEVIEWPKEQRLSDEKELLGFYASGHPLDQYRGIVDKEGYARFGELDSLPLDNKSKLRFCGIIKHVEHKSTKAGKPFGILHLEDFTGIAEVICWSESYVPAKEAELLEPGSAISIYSSLSEDKFTGSRRLTGMGGKACIKAVKVSNAPQKKSNTLELTLYTSRHTNSDLENIQSVIKQYPGKSPVTLHIRNTLGKRVALELDASFNIDKSPKIEQVLARYID